MVDPCNFYSKLDTTIRYNGELYSRFQQSLLLHARFLILHGGRAITVAGHVLESVTHDGVVAGGVGIFGSGHARVASPAVLPERVILATVRGVQGVVLGADCVADADDAFGGFAARGTASILQTPVGALRGSVGTRRGQEEKRLH